MKIYENLKYYRAYMTKSAAAASCNTCAAVVRSTFKDWILLHQENSKDCTMWMSVRKSDIF